MTFRTDIINRMSENEATISYFVNWPVANDELNGLFGVSWHKHEYRDFQPVIQRNLAHVCAYHSTILIGFVNLAWDGGIHAFVLDTTIHPDFRRRGIGQQLVHRTIDVARQKAIAWVHVDYESHLRSFYEDCGFKPTSAGLLNINLT